MAADQLRGGRNKGRKEPREEGDGWPDEERKEDLERIFLTREDEEGRTDIRVWM